MGSRVAFGIKLGLAALIFIYLIDSGHLQLADVGEAFQAGSWVLALVLLYAIGDATLLHWRWQQIVRCQGIDFSFSEAVRIGFIGLFFGAFLPGGIGGDAVRAYYITRGRTEQSVEAIATVFVDRLIGLLGLFLVASIACVINARFLLSRGVHVQQLLAVLWTCTLLAAIGSILILTGAFRAAFTEGSPLGRFPLFTSFKRLHDAIYRYRDHKRVLTATLLLSMTLHVTFAIMAYVLALAIGETSVPVGLFIVFVPLAAFVKAIPITPGGLGLGEAALESLLLIAGSAEGAEIGFLISIVTMLVSFGGVFFYLTSRPVVDAIVKTAIRGSNPASLISKRPQ